MVASQSAWAPLPPEKKLSVGDALPSSARAGDDPLAVMMSDAATRPIAKRIRSRAVFPARSSSIELPLRRCRRCRCAWSTNKCVTPAVARKLASPGGLELDEGRDVVARQPVAPAQGLELDKEREGHDLALQLLHEVDRAVDRTAGREQVVDDEDPRARLDRVLGHLAGRGAVLEVVLDGHTVGRRLAERADRDEPH